VILKIKKREVRVPPLWSANNYIRLKDGEVTAVYAASSIRSVFRVYAALQFNDIAFHPTTSSLFPGPPINTTSSFVPFAPFWEVAGIIEASSINSCTSASVVS
jgi:hypothetical protein